MKIELKLNNDTLIALDSELELVYDLPTSVDKHHRIMISIIYKVADKFNSKVKSLKKKATLFDTKKKHKISLEFYEAWALESALSLIIPNVNNPYQSVLIQKVINTLNQKLV